MLLIQYDFSPFDLLINMSVSFIALIGAFTFIYWMRKQAKDIGDVRNQFEASLLQAKGDEEELVTRLKEKYSMERLRNKEI